MTCEKCYHNEVCKALYELNGIPRIGATECAYFRDKDHLIEAPCEIKPTVTVLRKDFHNRIEVVKETRYAWKECRFCYSTEEAEGVEAKWKGEQNGNL